MNIFEKAKDKYEDLMFMIPDGMKFIIKCSIISIIWIILIC
jgi:hypothetical protein